MDYDRISFLSFAIGVCRYLLSPPVMIQDCKTAVSLIKGAKESYFWFVNKGNLERNTYVWLMLIEKNLEG